MESCLRNYIARRVLLVLFLCGCITYVQASHVRGFEMGYECVTSGQDSGKLIFYISGYRNCQGGSLSNSVQISNPLYQKYGGVSGINLGLLAGAQGVIDLSPKCYDSTQQRKCNVSGENIGVYDQFNYRSQPVLIIGVPDTAGSEFYVQASGGISNPANLSNYSGTYMYRLVMYPHINPNTSAPDTLGTPGSPSCYDSSPKYAEHVPFLAFIGVNNYLSNQCSDVDGDPLVYSFEAPKYSSTNYVQYATGYSGFNPFPNTSHHSGNIPLNLNPNTGNFTFTPYAPTGEFVIGHKTTSFRDGQKIAEVFRTYVMILDSLPSDPYNQKNKPPKITFKNSTSSTFTSTYADTFAVGQTVTINVKAEDYDSLNSSALQSVALRLIPQPHQLDPLNPNNCTYVHCAYLDTNNTAWKDSLFEDTSQVIASLIWDLNCDHLGALNPNQVSGVYKTYYFSFLATDNICPFPLKSIASMSITVYDTSETRNKIKAVQAQGDDNLIRWPIYSFSKPFTYYKVYRTNMLGGSYTLLATKNNVSDTSFLDTTCQATSTSYFYKIETAASLSCNPNANVVRSLLLVLSPSGLNAKLNWTDLTYYQPSLNSGNYKIYSDTGTGWQQRAMLGFGNNTWLDQSVSCNSTVKYKIEAFDQTNKVNYVSNVDSIYVAHYVTIPYSICPGDSIYLAGSWRKTAGTYTDTVPMGTLCDSVVNRVLTIDSVYSVSKAHTICEGDSIKIDGIWRNSSGIYSEILQSVKGCDSTINHELNVNPVFENKVDQRICLGDSVYDPIFKMYFKNEKHLIKFYKTNQGCDSNYVLTVDVDTVDITLSGNSKSLTSNQKGAYYQWIDCETGNQIHGAINRTFNPSVNGNYKVAIYYMGCSDTSACREVNGVGISEINKDKIEIFPNPTQGWIQVISSVSLSSYKVYSNIGEMVKNGQLNNNIIGLKDLPAGIYYIELSSQEFVIRKKIVKEK